MSTAKEAGKRRAECKHPGFWNLHCIKCGVLDPKLFHANGKPR